MTYRELNEMFFQAWADEKGIIRGKPVELIYKMNRLAVNPDDLIDEELLSQELSRKELELPIPTLE